MEGAIISKVFHCQMHHNSEWFSLLCQNKCVFVLFIFFIFMEIWKCSNTHFQPHSFFPWSKEAFSFYVVERSEVPKHTNKNDHLGFWDLLYIIPVETQALSLIFSKEIANGSSGCLYKKAFLITFLKTLYFHYMFFERDWKSRREKRKH